EARQAVIRLVRQSKEARNLLLQLHNDARALRSLRPYSFADGIAEKVLLQIGGQNVLWSPPAMKKMRAPSSVWIGWATAAAVLIALTGGWFYFAKSRTEDTQKSEEAVQIADSTAADHSVPIDRTVAHSAYKTGS